LGLRISIGKIDHIAAGMKICGGCDEGSLDALGRRGRVIADGDAMPGGSGGIDFDLRVEVGGLPRSRHAGG